MKITNARIKVGTRIQSVNFGIGISNIVGGKPNHRIRNGLIGL